MIRLDGRFGLIEEKVPDMGSELPGDAVNDAFIVYYLNYPKTVELCMTFENVIHTHSDIERLSENKNSTSKSLKGSMKAKLLSGIGASVSSAIDSSVVNSESYRIAETYEVKNTKSTYLKRLLRHAEKLSSLEEVRSSKQGQLLRVDGVSLFVLDDEEVLQMQILRHDALKGFRVEGIDVNNMISSMLEDYSYILAAKFCGTEGDEDEVLAVKVPSESANEFESKYRMRDLLLGKVSLLGVYKGKVSSSSLLTNTFTSLQGMVKPNASFEARVIKSADYGVTAMTSASIEQLAPHDVYYLDLIAILQPVCFAEERSDEVESKSRLKAFLNRLKTWLKGALR